MSNNTFLFYDTETTGLPLFKEPSEDSRQPRIIQLAALPTDEDGAKLSSMDALIHHEGLVIPKEISELTGITDAKCQAGGLPIGDALRLFLSMWERATARVAHNQSFDERMVRIELKRDPSWLSDLPDRWKAGQSFCTALATKPILQLPPTERMKQTRFANSFKTPNLTEAYRWATGKELTRAHNAMVDVMACRDVFLAIRAREQVEPVQ